MDYPLLKTIKNPEDIKKYSLKQLNMLCNEIRGYLIETISKTGGHLASNLGTVELTVAMHSVFDSPNDKFVFDVGHQCYTHKLLTGRMDKFGTLRQKGGISGFPKPNESEHDSFVSGHASTSIAVAYGISKAFELQNKENHAVAVIGDGAFTGGEAYEALNNAGRGNSRLIVIINHNDMSISKNVGALARYLSSIRSGSAYLNLKANVNKVLVKIPVVGKPLQRWIENSKSFLKTMIYGATFFEEMGFSYYGPVDGHDIAKLTRVLTSAKSCNKPVVVQVETIKGKGYTFAEENPGAYHAISSFDVLNGGDDVTRSNCYSNHIGRALTEFARDDKRICAITAAMKYGTGLQFFSMEHKNRFFDVGIAEGYAATFAGGLASQGLLPVFCVYSTFLQRSYDQVIHDLAIDTKHVVLCIDRAGIVGEDGETHQGVFDVSFLSAIPNVTIYSPSSYSEATLCLKEALYENNGVVAVRYPRGAEANEQRTAPNVNMLYIKNSDKSIIISYGRIIDNCSLAIDILKNKGIDISLLKVIKIHPLDKEISKIALNYENIFFVEEGIKSGGIAQQLALSLTENGFKGNLHVRAIEDEFIKQGKTEEIFKDLKFDSAAIADWIDENI